MDILTEDLKKELKEKFNGLDINDEKFQEKVQVIIDEAIVGNKDKIGDEVKQKTVDEALEEEKEGFREVQQLKQEGVWDNLKDVDLKERLKQKAEDGFLDESIERASLEKAGFLKDASKRGISIDDIVDEILRQLEEFIDNKKKEIDETLAKKTDMLKKVDEREKLRVSRAKVSNLHQKTKTYKGVEGKKLNEDVESAITDLDKQIEALVLETTVDGKELQSEDLKKEKETLIEQKKKLDDMLKSMKEKYSKNKSKDINKVFIKDEISKIASEVKLGIETNKMGANKLVEQSQAIREIYGNAIKAGYSKEEMKELLESVSLKISKPQENGKTTEANVEEEITGTTLMEIGKTNEIRRMYLETTSKADKTEEDKQTIENCQKKFEDLSAKISQICNGKKILPLQTKDEYLKELDDLEEKAQSKKGKFTKKMGGETEAQRACGKLRRLRNVLKEIVSADKTGSIRRRFNQVIDCLIENGFVNGVVEPETIPEVLEDNLKKKKSISKFKIEPPKHDNSGKTGEDKSTQRESDAEPVAVVPEEDVEVLEEDDYLL